MNGNKGLAIMYFMAIPVSLAAAMSALMASGDPNAGALYDLIKIPTTFGWIAGPIVLFTSASKLLSQTPISAQSTKFDLNNPLFPLLYLALLCVLTFGLGFVDSALF